MTIPKDVINSIRQRLDVLSKEKHDLNAQLEALRIASASTISAFENVTINPAPDLRQNFETLSELTHGITNHVGDLHIIKNNITSCIQRLNDVRELQSTAVDLRQAIDNEDYEQAAALVRRYRIISQSSHSTSNAQSELQSAAQSIETCRRQLEIIATEQFDSAIAEANMAEAMRYFKIFALLDLHDIGLQKFGRHLCRDLSSKAQLIFEEENETWIGKITSLLEMVGRFIEAHLPIFETYYGPTAKVIEFIAVIESEVDIQFGRFVQEFREGANIDNVLKNADQNEIEGDSLLNDLVCLVNRGELYARFLRRKLEEPSLGISGEVVDGFLQTVQEIVSLYIPLEDRLISQNISRAMKSGDKTTLVDRVFYFVLQSTNRALSTSNTDALCAVINNCVTSLDLFKKHLQNNLREGFGNNLEIVQALLSSSSSSNMPINDGELKSAESGEHKKLRSFIENLQMADECVDYTMRLRQQFDQFVTANTVGVTFAVKGLKAR
ncbi:hypothetical protein ACOME3_002759 [Neoechinorhynchus agilis]